MSSNVVWMVARREIKTRMLTKSTIISMAVMLVVIVAGIFVLDYFATRDAHAPASKVGVAQSVSALEEHLEVAAAQQGLDLELVALADDADAEEALTAEGDDALEAVLSGDPASPEMLVAEQPDDAIQQAVSTAVRSYVVNEQVTGLGGNPAAFEEALASAVPQVRSIEPEDSPDRFGPAYVVSMVMISLLLFALIGSGSIIAMGVVEEKTSRVVEILLATIKPTQLLAGKILGIGIFGMFQVVLLGGAAVGGVAATGLTRSLEVDLGASLALLVLWFLIGYAIFALLFGGFAALVSRQEEIGSVTTPLMFLLFVPYYLTMFMVPSDPDSTMVRVLSQIPVFAPFMMPVRNAFGALSGWELGLSLAISLATIPLLVWIAARVYQRGVLHTGGRMKLGDALKAGRS
ncbi:ABC transporter permease [Cellulomonas fimi]|uniref:ABC transporter permease n=1 Tax=Cellulomonas fimi TaxID=1708 RepID=A0A7Y0LW00_CELFI|nr:ABC transporter permease [Cellulomonas fimi]NMR19075.1 ABC transporter permease [Cellulomonas fimi]